MGPTPCSVPHSAPVVLTPALLAIPTFSLQMSQSCEWNPDPVFLSLHAHNLLELKLFPPRQTVTWETPTWENHLSHQQTARNMLGPNAQCDGIRRQDLWEMITSEGPTSWRRIVHAEERPAPGKVWGHSGNGSSWKQRTSPYQILRMLAISSWTSQPPELWAKQFLLLKNYPT
jgi:hypothetical protein